MKRAKVIGVLSVMCLLLTVLGQPAYAAASSQEHPSTIADQRCVTVHAPEAGRYWVTLSTQTPSTAPSLLVLATNGPDPQPMRRIEATLFEVEESGEHIVCLSSPAMVGHVKISFAKEDDPDKGGDPNEVEVEEDP